MPRSEVNGTAYQYEVNEQNAVTVWRVSRAGEAIVGKGRVRLEGERYRFQESSDGLTAPIMFAIENRLSGLD